MADSSRSCVSSRAQPSYHSSRPEMRQHLCQRCKWGNKAGGLGPGHIMAWNHNATERPRYSDACMPTSYFPASCLHGINALSHTRMPMQAPLSLWPLSCTRRNITRRWTFTGVLGDLTDNLMHDRLHVDINSMHAVSACACSSWPRWSILMRSAKMRLKFIGRSQR